MATTNETRPRGLLAELERIVLAVALAASVATLLLVSRSALVPTQRPLTFGMAFGVAFLGLYVALALFPTAIVVFLLFRRGLRRTSQLLVTLVIAGFCGAVGLWNAHGVRRAFALDSPTRFRYAVPVALALAVVGLLVAVFEPLLARRGRLVFRVTALLAIAATVLALSPLPPPTPITVAELVTTDAQSDAAHRFLLIGVDGADWRYIDPLIARGELPHLAELKQRGAFGPLKTFRPTLSPVVWTSIATGVPPGRHGVDGFFSDRFEGVSGPLPRIKPPRGLGFGLVDAWLHRRHVISQGPVGSDTRRVPAYWSIAAMCDRPVVVVNWWATWPAEPVDGVVVSDQMYFDRLVQKGKPPLTVGLVSPDDAFPEVDQRVVLPSDLPIEHARAYFDVAAPEFERMRHRDETLRPPLLREFNYYVASFETNRAVALQLIARQRSRSTPDALVLFRLVDKMGHAALEFSDLVEDHLGHSQTELARFGGVFAAAYRAIDDAVGQLMAAFGDANVIIVSDHGFQLERPEQPRYSHEDAPDGVFLAAGPAFRPGRVDGLSVYDVLPLLLYLKDLPTAADQPGALPRAALDPLRLAAQPERRIASYGTQQAPRLARSAASVDAERNEELRALGYIRY
jgi:hypothetical protein